jgi:hypothetical protein
MYICGSSAVAENELSVELLRLERKYKDKLFNLLQFKSPDRTLFRKFVETERTMFCKSIVVEINNFYKELNQELNEYSTSLFGDYNELNATNFLTACSITNEATGEEISLKELMNNLSVESSAVMKSYYTLYNGYIFYAYLGNSPIPENALFVIQTMFYLIGSTFCSLGTSAMVSMFFNIQSSLTRNNTEEGQKYMKSRIEDVAFVESIIRLICNTVKLYEQVGTNLYKGNFEISDASKMMKNLNNLLNKRDKIYEKYIKEEPKSPTAMQEIAHNISRMGEDRVVRLFPREKQSRVRDQLKKGVIYQIPLVAAASVVHRGTFTQTNAIIRFYNPYIPTTTTPKILERMWKGDMTTILATPGSIERSKEARRALGLQTSGAPPASLLRYYPQRTFGLVVYLMASNATNIHEYISGQIYPDDFNYYKGVLENID